MNRKLEQEGLGYGLSFDSSSETPLAGWRRHCSVGKGDWLPATWLTSRFFRLVAGALLIFSMGSATAATGGGGGGDGVIHGVGDLPEAGRKVRAFREDRVLVEWKGGTDLPQRAGFHGRHGSRMLREFPHLGSDRLQVLEVPPGRRPEDFIQDLKASGLVETAEPDFWTQPVATTSSATTELPNDPAVLAGFQWYLDSGIGTSTPEGPDIHATQAWATLHDAPQVLVALVDTGLRLTHEDLAANLWTNPGEIPGNGVDDDHDGVVDDVHGINAASNDGNPVDMFGHGTQVAGVLGAVGGNGLGISGVVWHVQLLPCRYSNDAGQGSLSDIIQCFDFARSKGAQVINASIATTNYSSALLTALTACRSAGIIVVAGAGNSATDNDLLPSYPAGYSLDNIVAVGASTRSDTPSSYANFGKTTVDLFAPGDDIYTTSAANDSAYVATGGSSFSTAMVTGACALLRARFPTWTYAQIIERLLSTVDKVPAFAGKCVTGGRLNLAAALGPSVVASFTSSTNRGAAPLNVTFTDTSFGSIASWEWSFGDGSSSHSKNPSHTFALNGSYTVSLTVKGVNGASSTTNLLVTAVGPYLATPTSFDWVKTSALTPLGLSGDGISAAQALPFSFTFYDQIYNSLYVGANGLIGFSPTGLTSAQNTDLPNAAAPNGLIAPYWDDLAPGGGSSIRFGIQGTAPDRTAVVSWEAVPTTGSKPATVSFEVILEETSHRIRFQYLEVQPGSTSPAAAGKTATIGVEDATGTIGTRFSFNGSRPLTNQQAILFTPPPTFHPPSSPQLVFQPSGVEGALQIVLKGDPNVEYLLQSTEDFLAWTTLMELATDASGTASTTLPSVQDSSRRFFRAFWQP